MRAQAKIRSALVTADTTLVTTAETAVAVVGGVSTQSPDGKVILCGQVSLATGASVTSVSLRIRRGSGVTGTVVGELESTTIGASTVLLASIQTEDTPGEVGGVSYTLTVVQNAATGNGTVATASLIAFS